MKKLIYILAAFTLLISACEVSPDAYFFVDENVVYIGEEVWFTNDSYNAYEYEWDFADGTYSDAVNPIHTFNASGEYDVQLTAYSKSGNIDRCTKTITVLAPTILEVEVLEWDLEYPVAGANVRLYPTLNDWDNETNMIVEGNTNNNGKVVFYDLGQFVHYVDVWEAEHNNFDMRNFDNADWLRTQQLVPNEINQFIAWVDYVGSKKGANGERDRSYVIKKLERVSKK